MLKKTFTKREIKKNAGIKKLISFKNEKFLFKNRFIIKITEINIKVKLIKRLPRTILTGKKANSINKILSR